MIETSWGLRPFDFAQDGLSLSKAVFSTRRAGEPPHHGRVSLHGWAPLVNNKSSWLNNSADRRDSAAPRRDRQDTVLVRQLAGGRGDDGPFGNEELSTGPDGHPHVLLADEIEGWLWCLGCLG